MAIHYWQNYSTVHGTRNFGDDINPFLLSKLFSREIIDGDDVCIVGIGTILNERNFQQVDKYERKIIFSSGAGYESIEREFDDSWFISCVRGPKTAAYLKASPDLAVTDGAALLSDFYAALPASRKEGVTFVPHVNTTWRLGGILKQFCDDLGINYVTPDLPFDLFVDEINRSAVVLAEAMHGAILADALRTPWVACELMVHNRFKWEDWCASLGVKYDPVNLGPAPEGSGFESLSSLPRGVRNRVRKLQLKARLKKLSLTALPQLSEDAVLESKKQALRDIVAEINAQHATASPRHRSDSHAP
jgi:succinoglycan biosynthesis protein ExoV